MLSLSNSQATRYIPPLAGLHNLQWLYLYNTHVPDIGKLDHIEGLTIYR
jgi:hypothetical protein